MSDYERITRAYFKGINLFGKFENSPRDFGVGELLYPSEIHTVVLIVRKPNLNLTELSCELGVSKSAVSKFVNKLMDKGLIIKKRARDNNKEVFFVPTEKGEKAARRHDEFEKDLFSDIENLINGLSEEKRLFLEDFLLNLNTKISKALEKSME